MTCHSLAALSARPALTKPRHRVRRAQGPDEAALARGLYRWSGGAPPLPLPLLDTHVHFYDPQRPGGVPWPPKENKLLYRTVQPQHLAELASGRGLAGCIAVECSAIVEDNGKLLRLAAAHPAIVRGVVGGGIEIGSKTFAEDVDKFAEHPQFVGPLFRPPSFPPA